MRNNTPAPGHSSFSFLSFHFHRFINSYITPSTKLPEATTSSPAFGIHRHEPPTAILRDEQESMSMDSSGIDEVVLGVDKENVRNVTHVRATDRGRYLGENGAGRGVSLVTLETVKTV
ncbi:hypothetical protein vseg_000859 [Gypsophila vaccaria]